MDTRIEDLENKLGIKPEERESLHSKLQFRTTTCDFRCVDWVAAFCLCLLICLFFVVVFG